jgi:uncharacterized membrane protein YidH (DUF202 family)
MSMKRAIGVVLIVLGLVALASGGVFWTRDKKVLDLGSVEVNTRKHEGMTIPPALGFAVLVGGIALLAIPERRGA